MDRSALLAALVAATAAIALALGAAALGPTLASDDGESGTAETPTEPSERQSGSGSPSASPAEGDDGYGCSSCSALDVRSHVAALLPAGDPRILFGALAVAVLGLAAVGLRSTEGTADAEIDDGIDEVVAERNDPEDRELGAGADVPPTNDVYRAWLALGEAVGDGGREEIDAGASPRERARRAIDAGFPAEPVRSLTRCFEAVRYGPAGATNEREREARAALDQLDGVELPSGAPASRERTDSPGSGDRASNGASVNGSSVHGTSVNDGDR